LSKRARSTHALELHVGQRIRQRRIMLGMTQQQLAREVGITYQQAHKYESGINRVSAGRLYQIAQVLQVDPNYFYENLREESPRPLNPRERISLDLARSFAKIRSDRRQEAVAHLVRSLADRGY
jgi:transcriptional regulator with XRE-family HTH domain